jgi:ankyrin repeat protein
MGKGLISLIRFTFIAGFFVSSLILALPIVSAALDMQQVAALEEAISLQDAKAVSELLTRNTNLCNAVVFWTRRPLIIAAARGWDEVVDVLLKNGADVNVQGDTWETSNHQLTGLHAAIWYNHPAICKRLLAAGANPNLQSQFNGTALHYAFTYGREEIAGWLLDAGANPFVEATNPHRPATASELAITHGNGKLVPRMLQASRVRSNVQKPGAESLEEGVLPPFTPEADRFLARRGVELLSVAAQRGELEAVEALLKAGVPAKEKTADGFTLLQAFARLNRATVKGVDTSAERRAKIRDLLEHYGADYDVLAATGLGDLETVRRLFAANKDLAQARDPEGQTPLHWSVRTDRLPLTAFWIEAGASLSATNLAGQTPLHLAAAKGLVAQTKALLAAKVPTNVRDTNGWTALEAAIQARQSETIRLFLSENKGGPTAERGVSLSIHRAAAEGNIAALSATANGENIDARSELGLTPLHLAIQRGHLGAAALLLDKGADVNARDPDGNSTLLLLMLHPPSYIEDRPSAAWLERRKADTQKLRFLRYVTSKDGEGNEVSALLQAAGLLLVCGADAAATNRAGQSVTQLLMSDSTFFFEEDRPVLLKLIKAGGGDIDKRDSNGDTSLHRAARELSDDQTAELIAGGADVNATNRLGRTPLHVSVECLGSWGYTPFQELLKNKPDINARDNEGATPLHLVAASDSIFRKKTTEALLAAGADPKIQDKQGRTPISLFLTGEFDSECIRMLLDHGADPSVADRNGRTPLHYLAALGKGSPLFFIRGITNCFPTPPVDVQARDQDGNTPLHIAAKSGTADVFTWLVGRGASLDLTNNAGETPRMLALHSRIRFSPSQDIFEAARNAKLETVMALLKAEPRLLNETNNFGQTPLRLAVMASRTNVTEFLSKQGVQWDSVSSTVAGQAEELRKILSQKRSATAETAYGKGLLHLAAASRQIEAASVLLDAGFDLRTQDDWGLSPLGNALLRRQTEMEDWLRKRGATENMFDAAYANNVTVITQLLARNQSFAHATNRFRISVAQVAAFKGANEILAVLLKQGVPVGLADERFGNTLLHLAAFEDHNETAEMLIRRGAVVDAFDKYGFTPLHLAANLGGGEVVKVLLQHNANPNLPTGLPQKGTRLFITSSPYFGAGDTALHLAAQAGATNIILSFLHSGVSINVTNILGRTPLDNASGPPPIELLEPRAMSRILEPFNLMESPVTNAVRLLQERRAVAATLIEQLGGKKGRGSQSGVRMPRMP